MRLYECFLSAKKICNLQWCWTRKYDPVSMTSCGWALAWVFLFLENNWCFWKQIVLDTHWKVRDFIPLAFSKHTSTKLITEFAIISSLRDIFEWEDRDFSKVRKVPEVQCLQCDRMNVSSMGGGAATCSGAGHT
jgi:hypothetical protein